MYPTRYRRLLRHGTFASRPLVALGSIGERSPLAGGLRDAAQLAMAVGHLAKLGGARRRFGQHLLEPHRPSLVEFLDLSAGDLIAHAIKSNPGRTPAEEFPRFCGARLRRDAQAADTTRASPRSRSSAGRERGPEPGRPSRRSAPPGAAQRKPRQDRRARPHARAHVRRLRSSATGRARTSAATE